MRKLAVFAGSLVMLVGVPAGTLYALGQLHASPLGYLAGLVVGLALMAALAAALSHLTPDPFVLEVSITFAFAAGLAFAAWLALRNR